MLKHFNFYSFCCLLTCTAFCVVNLRSSHENWENNRNKLPERLTPHRASAPELLGKRKVRDDNDALATAPAPASSSDPVEEQDKSVSAESSPQVSGKRKVRDNDDGELATSSASVSRARLIERQDRSLRDTSFDIQNLFSSIPLDVILHHIYPMAYNIIGMNAPNEDVRRVFIGHYDQYLREKLNELTPLDWNNHITAEIALFNAFLRENSINYTVSASQPRTYLSSLFCDRKVLQEQINLLKENELIRNIRDEDFQSLFIFLILDKKNTGTGYNKVFLSDLLRLPVVQARQILRLFLSLSRSEQRQLFNNLPIENEHLTNARRDARLIWANQVFPAFMHSLQNRQFAAAERLAILLDNDEINRVDNLRRTPLMKAAEIGALELTRFLVEKGANVNAAARDRWTPLFFAAEKGHQELADFLIEKGADVNAKDYSGDTPLTIALWRGALDLAHILVAEGADVNAVGLNGRTPLNMAVAHGCLDLTRSLVEKGADVNAERTCGVTPIMVAAESGHPELVRFLLDKGADIDAVGDCKTPVMYAAMNGNLNCLTLLLQEGARLDVGEDGDVFTLAAVNCHLNVLEYLLTLEDQQGERVFPQERHRRDGEKKFLPHVLQVLLEGSSDLDVLECNFWFKLIETMNMLGQIKDANGKSFFFNETNFTKPEIVEHWHWLAYAGAPLKVLKFFLDFEDEKGTQIYTNVLKDSWEPLLDHMERDRSPFAAALWQRFLSRYIDAGSYDLTDERLRGYLGQSMHCRLKDAAYLGDLDAVRFILAEAPETRETCAAISEILAQIEPSQCHREIADVLRNKLTRMEDDERKEDE